MKLILTRGRQQDEFVLMDDASGVVFNDATIFNGEGVELANWSFSEGDVEGWFPEVHGAPEDFFEHAELRP